MSKVYIDFDNVICKTTTPLLKAVNKKFGKDYKFENITEWNIDKCLKMTKEEWDFVMNDCFGNHHWVFNLPEVKGTVNSIKEMQKDGHEVVIVTSRPHSTDCASKEWLYSRGIFGVAIVYLNKHARNEKETYPYVTWDDIVKMKFDYAFDDSQEACEILNEFTDVRLISAPWNKSSTGIKRISRNGYMYLVPLGTGMFAEHYDHIQLTDDDHKIIYVDNGLADGIADNYRKGKDK